MDLLGGIQYVLACLAGLKVHAARLELAIFILVILRLRSSVKGHRLIKKSSNKVVRVDLRGLTDVPVLLLAPALTWFWG
jgi:hypothetical protein